jgi:hypothetical protein
MKPRPQRRSGNLSALKVELWAGIRYAAKLLEETETPPELKLRAVSALATAGSVYAKLLEAKPDADETPAVPADVIVIRSTTGSNGHHG